MTIQSLLTEAKHQLSNSPTPSLDAELLLSHCLEQGRAYLISHGEEEVGESALKQFMELVKKRKEGSPLAYLIQSKEFFGRNFYVDERVLIPRPETEEMLEDAIAYLTSHPEVSTIIDLGTGSGCLAISLSIEFPDRQVIGLEVSSPALEVAIKNAKTYPSDNLTFLRSDLLSSYPNTLNNHNTPHTPICILANLPYIGTDTNNDVYDETAAHEPDVALYGGADGLELYRETWQQIKDMKLTVSALFMEISFSQSDQMEKDARKAFPKMNYNLKHDLAGLPRTAILSI